jgi:hypothetical protein
VLRERNAALVLTLMALNYGVRAASHHEALQRAPEVFGPLLPQRCPDQPSDGWLDRWPRAPVARPLPGAGESPAESRCLEDIAAMPNFLSPFRWRLIAQLTNGYEIHDIDLLTRRRGSDASGANWRLSVRYPNQWTPAVMRAAAADIPRVYLGFSRFPAARSVVDEDGSVIVRWNDMRFVDMPLSGRRPAGRTLFSVVVRLDPSGQVVEQKFGP